MNSSPQNLDRLLCQPKTGRETLNADGEPLGFDLFDFWRWSASDLVSNATRGRFAEFIVATALSVSVDGVRDEWSAYDLETPDGIRVEVKSAAFVQSWQQSKLSAIGFRTPKTRAWDAKTNQQKVEPRRQAHVYVFALLAHQDKSNVDPLNVRHWQFYVVPTPLLDARTRSQHSITLRSLEALAGKSVSYEQLRFEVDQAAAASGKKIQRPAE